MEGIQRVTATAQKTLGRTMKKVARTFRDPRMKILSRCSGCLIEREDRYPILQSAVSQMLFETPLEKSAVREIKALAVAVWIAEWQEEHPHGRLGKATIARAAGISRRTFLRQFGWVFEDRSGRARVQAVVAEMLNLQGAGETMLTASGEASIDFDYDEIYRRLDGEQG
jgi:hypothetical protein